MALTLWSALGRFPPAAYADTNFLFLLWEFETARGNDSRRGPAVQFLHRLANAGTEVWTSMLATQEACWLIWRDVIRSAQQAAGKGNLSPKRFKLEAEYPPAAERANLETRLFVQAMLQVGIRVRSPHQGGRATDDDLLIRVFRVLQVQYRLEPADTWHLALAWCDRDNPAPALISDDRDLKQVSEVDVFAYTP